MFIWNTRDVLQKWTETVKLWTLLDIYTEIIHVKSQWFCSAVVTVMGEMLQTEKQEEFTETKRELWHTHTSLSKQIIWLTRSTQSYNLNLHVQINIPDEHHISSLNNCVVLFSVFNVQMIKWCSYLRIGVCSDTSGGRDVSHLPAANSS